MQDLYDRYIRYRSHRVEVPLDHSDANSTPITIFAREVVDTRHHEADLPWLVYFQGGPGMESPRPNGATGWLKRALDDYRVMLLDQRGTGLSSPVNHQTLAHLTPAEQAAYLSHFRADSIVKDAECLREALGIKQWAILGQSFGGFCALTYLSFFPQSLSRAFVTGGIPPLEGHADAVYQKTYQRVEDKNQQFFAQFPDAQARCHEIAQYLQNNTVTLPNGQPFTVEQFQTLGLNLGRGHAGLPLYYLLERAFIEVNDERTLSYPFLNAMQADQGYLTNPFYAILHESIYCQQQASQWSAHRVRDQFPQFHYQPDQPFRFTGEMVYPWMFDQLATLKPLKDAAMLLAEKSDWPALYDLEVLKRNTVPLACATYVDDMFVEFDYSRQTLAQIANSQAWMTNEYEHNGIGVDGERILSRLIEIGDHIAATQASGRG
ncbi:alpha/beta hydrolase [Salinivibrio sp. MA440]|uniref:alpha/beta fold hydrolase n=1 Tax=Salinivibrio sp. MA440 TaxID=1909456 RepID=UPI0009889E7A|nr:alpha/beta fold hydrolase [Salinivibrio sp. MA440]OOF01782.1 alpha/beta hydrolase [Salinivibrio sp. MA440]